MRYATPAIIEIVGVNGESWTVSGPGMGQEGVELAQDPSGLHDEAPVKGIWQQSAYQEGATYQGHTIEPIDLVLAFHILPEFDNWEDIESRFYASFDFERPATIRYTTDDGTRELKVVKYAATKTSSKIDPRIYQYSKIQLTLRAPDPYWVGETTTVSKTLDSGTSTASFTVSNPTDRPMWLQWVVTAPGVWRIPDYDLAAPAGSGQRTRRIITPTLYNGQNLSIDTHPLNETYISSDGTNIAGRFNGVDFLYPVPAHTPPTTYSITHEGSTSGSFQCRMVETWQRPWGGRIL